MSKLLKLFLILSLNFDYDFKNNTSVVAICDNVDVWPLTSAEFCMLLDEKRAQ